MKTLITIILAAFLSVSSFAQTQTVTLTFQGNNVNKSYQVIIDNAAYYSTDAVSAAGSGDATVNGVITIPNLPVGSHTLTVYRIKNINNASGNNGKATYTNTFQLRQGYDMDISIKGNSAVSFSEKRVRKNHQGNFEKTVKIPMSDNDFAQLLKSVKGQWIQSGRVAILTDAFNNTSYNFSTNQIVQLLSQVKSEANRLSLAKLAWNRVSDVPNFNQVYSLFSSQTSKDELATHVRNTSNTIPTYDQGYTKTPMATYDFNQLSKNTYAASTQLGRLNVILASLDNANNYFTTAQARQLILALSAETDRLYLAKRFYPRITDPSNINMITDVFTSMSAKDEFYNFTKNNNTQTTTIKTAMASYQFSQLMQNINYSSSQSTRFNNVRDALNNTANYFSTAQVRQLLQAINSETDRLYLAKIAYAKTTDQNYFSSLYDLLSSQNSRDELARFIGGNTSTVPTKTPMSDASFNQIYQTASGHFFQASVVKAVKDAFLNTSNIFSTSQVKQLVTLIQSETERLSAVKLAYPRASNPSEFSSLTDLFTTQSVRNEFTTFIGGSVNTGGQYSSRTAITDAAFTELYNSANLHFRQSSKVTAVRDAFNTNNYFTISQIRQLLSIITTETDRLELAKLAYRRATDPTYFSDLADLFSSQESKNELNAYIEANKY